MKDDIVTTLEQSAAMNSAENTLRDLCFSLAYRSLHCSIDVSAMSAQITWCTRPLSHFKRSPPFPHPRSRTFKRQWWPFSFLILSNIFPANKNIFSTEKKTEINYNSLPIILLLIQLFRFLIWKILLSLRSATPLSDSWL